MKTREIKQHPDVYAIENIRVVDGDTLEADVLLPFQVVLRKRIRLKGWWADETTGPWAYSGQQAQLRLTQWIEGKALWISSPSQRLDRYGRVIAHLVHHAQIINAKDVLGELALTEKVHQLRKDQAKNLPQMTPERRAAVGDIGTADLKSKRPINDSGAKSVATALAKGEKSSAGDHPDGDSDWENIDGADEYSAR